MEADQVGAGLDGGGRSGRVADAADLHLDHAVSSLMRSSGFSARISASPTRIALAPASYTRRASAASLMPLSATTTTVGRDQLAQPLGESEVDLEGSQVAVVDPDELGPGLQGDVRLALVVDLDERRDPTAPGNRQQVGQVRPVQGGHDQENRVGSRRPGLGDLVRVGHEVLAEDR